MLKGNNREAKRLAENILHLDGLTNNEKDSEPIAQNTPTILLEEPKNNQAEPKIPTKNTTSSSVIKNSFDDIEDIIMRTITSYGLNGVYIANDVSVLYKNGDVFTNPHRPLETFDIAASKRDKPRKWNSWKRQNGVLYVTYSKTGKVYDWKKIFKVRSVKAGFKLNGKFDTIDPFGGAVVINASTVFFDNNGRFVWDNVRGGSTDISSAYVKSKYKGTYHISKHTITLTYLNGATESYFFAMYPESDKHFILGESHFVPED